MTGLATDLGLVWVAEGVETAEQHAYLASLGSGLGQGYRYSRPLPGDELLALLGGRNHGATSGSPAPRVGSKRDPIRSRGPVRRSRGDPHMSGAAIAALIAAGAFVLLVLLLAFPLLKLGRTLDEATLAVRKTHEGVAPIMTDAQATVTQLNAQLVHIEGIAKNVNSMTTNVAAMTSVVSATLGSPMIKAAAFTYGVRKTVSTRRDADAVRDARRKHRATRRGR